LFQFPCLRFTFLAFVSLSLPSFHFPCLRFTFLAFVSLSLPSFHFPCLCFTFLAFVSLSLPSFHFPCLCFTFLAFVSFSLPSFQLGSPGSDPHPLAFPTALTNVLSLKKDLQRRLRLAYRTADRQTLAALVGLKV
jgi:hypothetical protein